LHLLLWSFSFWTLSFIYFVAIFWGPCKCRLFRIFDQCSFLNRWWPFLLQIILVILKSDDNTDAIKRNIF
jgi:hypothetical protein